MSNPDKKTDYNVGYGKPPPQHRFKKGQSGNPKGRPRKTVKPQPQKFQDNKLDTLLEQEAFRSLQLHENGKPVEMSAAQAIMRSILVDGVKGNRLAKKYAIELLRKEERDALQQQHDYYAYFAQKKTEGEAKIAQCEEDGVELPRLYPHPDDILLDEAKLEVHLLGPLSEDQAIAYERSALLRDWLHTQWVFQEKYGEVATIGIEGKSAASAAVLAIIIEDALPPSFQRGDISTTWFLVRLQGLGKRQLAKQLEALKTDLANLPDSIEEQLVARERAERIMGMIGGELEQVVDKLAMGQGLPDQIAAHTSKKSQ